MIATRASIWERNPSVMFEVLRRTLLPYGRGHSEIVKLTVISVTTSIGFPFSNVG
jgi:hypothetical protein